MLFDLLLIEGRHDWVRCGKHCKVCHCDGLASQVVPSPQVLIHLTRIDTCQMKAHAEQQCELSTTSISKGTNNACAYMAATFCSLAAVIEPPSASKNCSHSSTCTSKV